MVHFLQEDLKLKPVFQIRTHIKLVPKKYKSRSFLFPPEPIAVKLF
jgi:hypothetical protein